MDRYHKIELKKAEENERQLQHMRKKLKDEEMRILRGEKEVDENMLDQEMLQGDEERYRKKPHNKNMMKPKGEA